MLERQRKRTTKDVIKEADLMVERFRAQTKRQADTITSMMAYLEQTDQVAAYIRWRDKEKGE